jgi:transketolase
LIANTVKGKGIDFMENSTQWHGIQNMSKKQLEQINKSLEAGQ